MEAEVAQGLGGGHGAKLIQVAFDGTGLITKLSPFRPSYHC